MDCIFCAIATHEIHARIVWEDDRFAAFLDVKPVNPGHILIIPKDHVEVVFDLDDARYAAIFEAAKTLAPPILRATDAQRIGIQVEGFGVAHAHVHLVPLHGPGELNPERARAADPAALDAMAERIKTKIAEGHESH